MPASEGTHSRRDVLIGVGRHLVPSLAAAAIAGFLIAQWWGRGNKVDIEKYEPEKGGHWRIVEHSDGQTHGFEGRFREITPIERIVQTFEWDGMPGYVIIDTAELEDLGDGRTRLVSTSLFHTTEERDGMASSGMAEGAEQSYQAIDRLLASME